MNNNHKVGELARFTLGSNFLKENAICNKKLMYVGNPYGIVNSQTSRNTEGNK